MANKSKPKSSKGSSQSKESPQTTGPWISMRIALIIMGIVSAGLAIFIGWNAIQTQGLIEGIAWGLGFGLANWVIFYIAYRFFKWSRGG